jgi:hypothetical protein
MTGLIVDNVSLNDDVIIMIVAKTGAETTPPFPLRANTKYTLLSSTLGAGENILGEIYDPSRSVWQAWYYQGNRVKLAQNEELFFFEGVSSMVRFVKTTTASPVGLTFLYS